MKLWQRYKIGEEEITRDIPNVNEEALKNLRWVWNCLYWCRSKAWWYISWKVTPKGDSASGPEEKLLRSIFGEKAIDVTDTSLRCPEEAVECCWCKSILIDME